MKRFAFVLIASLAWAGAAQARDLPAGGMTAQEVADWLRAAGLTATIKPEKSDQNGPIISTAADGVNFDIYMYNCPGDRCTALQYAAGWSGLSTTVDQLNTWNRDHRYIRAYRSDVGIFGEYDVDLSPGGTYEQLGGSLTQWRTRIANFSKTINAK